MEEKENHIVYMILDDQEVVLYVGRTKRTRQRLTREHFTSRGNVDIRPSIGTALRRQHRSIGLT